MNANDDAFGLKENAGALAFILGAPGGEARAGAGARRYRRSSASAVSIRRAVGPIALATSEG